MCRTSCWHLLPPRWCKIDTPVNIMFCRSPFYAFVVALVSMRSLASSLFNTILARTWESVSPPKFFTSFNGVIASFGEVGPGDEETRPAPGKVLPWPGWPGWLISAIFSTWKDSWYEGESRNAGSLTKMKRKCHNREQ